MKPSKMKNKLIALTGGIGSGKSSALEILSSQGVCTLSCDQVGRQLYKKASVKRRIKKMFPDTVDGKLFLSIDRVKLAQKVFNNEKNYALLSSFTTPLILKATLKKAKRLKKNVVVEVPLLFEFDSAKFFDGVIVVVRDKAQRIKAVMERSNLTEEQVYQRMNHQIDYDTYNLTEFKVISNDTDKQALKEKVLNAYSELINN